MRQKMVWRYWCDHCRKGGCGKAAMAKHELHCSRNPNRVCRMCIREDMEQKPIGVLVDALVGRATVDELRKVANGCPACMLAARIALLHSGEIGEDDGVPYVDFAAESARFWADVHQGEREYYA